MKYTNRNKENSSKICKFNFILLYSWARISAGSADFFFAPDTIFVDPTSNYTQKEIFCAELKWRGGGEGQQKDETMLVPAVVSSFISPPCFGAKDKHLNGILYSKVESFSELFSSYTFLVYLFKLCKHFCRFRMSLFKGRRWAWY